MSEETRAALLAPDPLAYEYDFGVSEVFHVEDVDLLGDVLGHAWTTLPSRREELRSFCLRTGIDMVVDDV